MNYNVGDKIRIKENAEDFEVEGTGFVSGMIQYQGKMATITRILSDDTFFIDIDDEEWVWHKDYVTVIEKGESEMETLMAKGTDYELTEEQKERLLRISETLLTQYQYEPTRYALKKILENWVKRKGWIINLLFNHQYYNGNFQVVIPANLKRPIDTDGIYTFQRWAIDAYKGILKANKIMIGLHDYVEYMRATSKVDNIYGKMICGSVYKGLTEAEWGMESMRMNKRIHEADSKYNPRVVSDSNGDEFAITADDNKKLNAFGEVLYSTFYNVKENGNLILKDREGIINSELANGNFKTRAVAGQKISKFIGKLCKEIGIDHVVDVRTQSWTDANGFYHERQKDMGWNYHKALLGDSVNPLSYTREIVISVNPIDFWTMSFGYKWASCHTIDKRNQRRVPNHNYEGCYSGGTESYMLDDSSVIVYVRPTEDEIKSIGEEGMEMELQSKFKRCMFYLGEDKLVQSRLYPDGRDGGDDGLAAQIRNIVQKEIADLLDTPNMWTLKKGTSACSDVIITESRAPHYPDYNHYSDCNVSYLRRINGDLNHNRITVGSEIICPSCGCVHSEEKWITCDDCHREEFATCEYCDDPIYANDDYIETMDGAYYCCCECAENAGYHRVEDDSRWCSDEDCYYDDYEGCYYHDDWDAVYIDGYSYRNSENAECDGWRWCDYDGDWAREDDAYEIGDTGSYFICYNHEYIETVDGKYYLDEETAIDNGYTENEDGKWVLAA